MTYRGGLSAVVFLWLVHSILWAQHWTQIDHEKSIGDKTALLIMNGFGGSKSGCKAQMEFWGNQGMDVFIPDVLLRKSLNASSAAMHEFIEEYAIAEYGDVKAVCYIAGAFLLHTELESHPLPNLSAIIYDRSPTQERAPKAVAWEMPFVGWLAMGPVLKDLAEATWPEPPNAPGIKKGLAIENRATNIMRILEATARAMGPLDYDWRAIDPSASDAFHVGLDHNMMYVRWDLLGEPYVYFFENGRFPEGLPRQPIFDNPFDKSNPIPQ